MRKGIYTYYKERLIEIGGNNKCLYLKNIGRKSAYDLGRVFEGRDEKVAEFVDFLWNGGKYPLTVIGSKEKKDILENILPHRKQKPTQSTNDEGTETEEPVDEQIAKKMERLRRMEADKAIENEINRVKELKREIEEVEKDTGRYELYLGYPFVFGCIPQGSTKTLIKAPLLLFPITIDIDDTTVEIRINESEKVHINHALIYAYAQSKKINIEQLELEFDNLSSHFKTVKDVVDYLNHAHIKIDCTKSNNVYGYGKIKEPDTKSDLSVRYAAVIARFPLSNSIYNDYTLLEKKNLTNDAVSELLRMGKCKKKKQKQKKAKAPVNNYIVKMLDYAQSQVVKKVDEQGNMVISGPPGTGKSQTIVNIITDAICKHKSVLVVSQKKAALDVVYNRLGVLNRKAMYIIDESKEKQSFYDRCLTAHQNDMIESLQDVDALENQYQELQNTVNQEEAKLQLIFRTLNDKREPFGLSLAQMYSHSSKLQKTSSEYSAYLKLIENKKLMSLSYKELRDALFGIKSMNLAHLYYEFMQDKEKNPLIDNMLQNLDIRTLSEVKAQLEDIQKSKKGLFNTSKYPYYRQVLTYYNSLNNEETVDRIVKLEAKLQYPKTLFRSKQEAEIKEQFLDTLDAIELAVKEYDCLHRVLTQDGYLSVIDNILRGNTSYLKLVYDALDNYIALRDVNKLLESLDNTKLEVLNFAYISSKNKNNYNDIIDNLIEIRIYHEILKYEEALADDLAMTVDFPNITEKIYQLKEQQLGIAYKLCSGKNSQEYDMLYEKAKNNKDYLYQISKKQKYWPIRKTMEVYSDFILSLFPCWLLSPENVSNLLPLEKNLFDIVIFDEASQVFIENTIPTIYRGKSIVVAGDEKQLRPSTTFMKRYLGTSTESNDDDDYSVQAALEVDSLLDLAVSRYESANLTYHYRSKNKELIDFSNSAFYGTGLQIAPNISKNNTSRPIERYKVKGKWIDRKNIPEAKKIVELLKNIFATRENNESIGIITFNADQQSCIADMIDKECSRDPEFCANMMKERIRIENGEDVSIFIKNLENVQGDERDIIIFSIGYAENENGKLYSTFGSLSVEGGENRLNVAITRAKTKIIVVTSIEPEELRVENSKNMGPKLLQKYLMYTRAVANGDNDAVNAILKELDLDETKSESMFIVESKIESEMKEKLEKLGYSVDTKLGNSKNRISLAVYDKKTDKYLVGIELDKDAFASSDSCMERDVYKPRFLEARGWTILRVWCRDWWLYPQKVIRTITQIAEKNRSK